jgi:tRNA (guanine-N7-)-methyltransferase
MSSSHFLKRYARIMKPGGLINLKTDSDFLYDRSIETIEEGSHHILKNTTDLYANLEKHFSPEAQEILNVKTFYERKFLARKENINYIQFQLNDRFYQAQQEE